MGGEGGEEPNIVVATRALRDMVILMSESDGQGMAWRCGWRARARGQKGLERVLRCCRVHMKATSIGRRAEDGDGRRSGTCSFYCLSRDIDLASSAFFCFDDAACVCVCDAFQTLYSSVVPPPNPGCLMWLDGRVSHTAILSKVSQAESKRGSRGEVPTKIQATQPSSKASEHVCSSIG